MRATKREIKEWKKHEDEDEALEERKDRELRGSG
jgi:hypothetical protein